MNMQVFKRKAYNKLLEWKLRSNGRSAILIEGARRVGKSTLVTEFAKQEYKSCIIIDFNNVTDELLTWFDGLVDLDYLFLRLQTYFKVSLHTRQSVIVFDEVQKCPKARQAIKYLAADGRYDYIETGSLISIHQNTKDITIPSEEESIEMFPMDFEEFLWALGHNDVVPLLKQFLEKRLPLSAAHLEYQRLLRTYMLVGGMPQAVLAYLQTNNFQEVDSIKRQIVKLYENDFIKLDPSKQLSKMFLSIPAMLSKNQSRYTPFPVLGRTSAEELMNLLITLEDSKVINIAYHADDPNVGFALNADMNRYKLFIGDTGLFVTLCFWDKDYTENVIYQKLLSDKLQANLGYIYENLVAQMLRASGNKLFYFTFPKDEKHNYEIDFLLSRGNKILPIEVKSGNYRTFDSLTAFASKFSSRIAKSYILHTKDLRKEEQILCVPMYFASII